MFKKSVFIFHRDLRIEDNVGLTQALRNSEYVIPVFIIRPKFNSAPHRWEFLNESLIELSHSLSKMKSELLIVQDEIPQIINYLKKDDKVEAIFSNTDFSQYAKKRDEEIYLECKKHDIKFNSFLDHMLHDPNTILTKDGKPYTIFSFFFKEAKNHPVKKPDKNKMSNFGISSIKSNYQLESFKINAGRKNALKILENISNFKNYDSERNIPYIDGTTRLSAHHRFGTVSIREVYDQISSTLGREHTLISEIYWREFFSYILYHFPKSQFNEFKEKYRKISWSKNKKNFDAWCKGNTGFPIVDAGMRELNSTGFMHNRVRMIVASFLVKDLHIDWRDGERYFAKMLADYDPAVNVGNWQWAASTGCDSVPYFRIFNPWLQQEKFDNNCNYIKNWVKELETLLPKEIHNLWRVHPPELGYPKPIVVHSEEVQVTKKIFKSVV